MPDYYTGYWDEAALRGGGGSGSGYVPDYTPINTQFTYNNGRTFAGTNTPMSDQAYELMLRSQNGIPTTADISGTGGVGQSLHNAASFELDHIGNIFEGLTDPTRIFGIDPITTEIGNAVFGTNNEPLVNQMGGATSQQIRDYEAKHGTNSAGGAQGLHNAAAGTAGIIAAGTLANGGLTGGGQGGGTNLYTMTPAEQADIVAGLTNVPAGGAGQVAGFGGYGTAGIPTDLAGTFASTNAGAAGNGLVLSGGAGTGVPSWLSTAGEYADDVSGLLGNGGGGGGAGGGQAPMMPGMFGSPMRQPQPQQPRTSRLPILQGTQPQYQAVGRRPFQFRGQTVWM